MVKKPCLKVQILQYRFLDWKWPPPFGTFPKIHPIWKRASSLREEELEKKNYKDTYDAQFENKEDTKEGWYGYFPGENVQSADADGYW